MAKGIDGTPGAPSRYAVRRAQRAADGARRHVHVRPAVPSVRCKARLCNCCHDCTWSRHCGALNRDCEALDRGVSQSCMKLVKYDALRPVWKRKAGGGRPKPAASSTTVPWRPREPSPSSLRRQVSLDRPNFFSNRANNASVACFGSHRARRLLLVIWTSQRG